MWSGFSPTTQFVLFSTVAERSVFSRSVRHAKHGSFFLDSAGVGENQARVIVHIEKIEAAKRIQWDKAGECRFFLGEEASQAEALDVLAHARMYLKKDREISGDRTNCSKDAAQHLWVIHVRRPMQG